MGTKGTIISFLCSGRCEMEHYPDYTLSCCQSHADAIGVKVQRKFFIQLVLLVFNR